MARVIRASTSAGLRNVETGEIFPGNGGLHVYLFVRDGADIPRFVHDLQKRAWLDGLGWIMVSSRGALLVRSIVDVTVGSPERLVFEGMPSVVAPLTQDQEARRPIAHEGDILDTASACPPLTPEEEQRYAELVDAAKREKQPEVEAAKETAAEAIASLRSIAIEKARAVVAASTQGELWSWDVLHFDDEAIGEIAVAEVLADPARFHGATLADPLEGRSYGRSKAKLYWNANNTVIINSFAHGGCVYAVHHDADYIEAQVEDAGARRAVRPRRAHGARPRPRRRHARTPAQPRRQGRRRGQARRRGDDQGRSPESQAISRRCRACRAATGASPPARRSSCAAASGPRNSAPSRRSCAWRRTWGRARSSRAARRPR